MNPPYSMPIHASNQANGLVENPYPISHNLPSLPASVLTFNTPKTSKFLQADTQSSTLLHSRCTHDNSIRSKVDSIFYDVVNQTTISRWLKTTCRILSSSSADHGSARRTSLKDAKPWKCRKFQGHHLRNARLGGSAYQTTREKKQFENH